LPQHLAGSLVFLVLIGGLGLPLVARLPFAADEWLALGALGLALHHALRANPVS